MPPERLGQYQRNCKVYEALYRDERRKAAVKRRRSSPNIEVHGRQYDQGLAVLVPRSRRIFSF